ncbi:MAG: hypothetical protein DI551_06935 [Micavibrio aeruginosavorus]|uniref:Uncharacterized protein n=1 Tax=Micavibrio aeruginosavorus TaxID=349221 RepID=A0A2W5MWK8_9BACT|nr:MAG: hypothetical protein DI551_06935 [Micavibrio aeruginosavorus]
MKKYLTNKDVTFFLMDSKWGIYNPYDESIYEFVASPTMVEALAELDHSARTKQDIISIIQTKTYTNESIIVGAIDALIETGFFIEQDQSIPLPLSCSAEWFSYWKRRDYIHHADYSDPSIFDFDKSIMASYACDKYPDLYKEYEQHKPDFLLSHPAYSGIDAVSKFGHFMFYCFGRLREATFLDTLPCQLKCVPSKGGRHPFEAYVCTKNSELVPDGLYHYPVNSHSLRPLSGYAVCPDGISIFVTGIFDRYQWRYRNSWAYKDLYYDLGHLKDTVISLAKYYGWSIEACDDPDKFLYETPLYEEKLFSFHINFQERKIL